MVAPLIGMSGVGGLGVGAVLGSTFGGKGRKKVNLGSEVGAPTEREQWRIDRMKKLLGEQAPDDEVLRAIATDQGMSDRFVQNVGEFYSHPGAYQALQQAVGLYGQQAPNVYGADWESAVRARMSQGVEGQLAEAQGQANSGMAARGMYGAMGQAQQTQIGQASALARLQGMLGLRTTLDDKRYQMFQDQFARDYQASGLLQQLVTGQSSYPIQQKQEMSTDEKIMGYMGAAGGLLGGVGSFF